MRDDPAVAWPVTVRLPVAGGEFKEFAFVATIRVLPEKAVATLFDGTILDPKVDQGAAVSSNAEKLADVVIGWEHVLDGENTPVPFSREILLGFLAGPYGVPLAMGLFRAINEIRYGARLPQASPSAGGRVH
ncbi:MAG: hypothetical protein JNM82_13035 [Rhodocyclaceae bacterium]|nr:hypothetical protein [Rhodocyclaceae bacterium]